MQKTRGQWRFSDPKATGDAAGRWVVLREIFSISIFGGGLWISGRFRVGRNQRSKRRPRIVSEAKVPGLRPRSVWMRKSEKLALSIPGEWQLSLTPQ